MSTFADVVFCVDCDLKSGVRAAGADSAAVNQASEPQRRMATKKDANGDALCRACLDARHAQRQAEFKRRSEPPPTPVWQRPLVTMAERFSRAATPAVVPKVKPPVPVPAGVAAKRAPKSRSVSAESSASSARIRRTPARAPGVSTLLRGATRSEKQFVSLATAIGLRRAQELLDRIQAAARTIVARY